MPDTLHILAQRIKTKALELGFELCGIAPVRVSAFKERFQEWLEQGFAADMSYMKGEPERRLNPRLVMPSAKSIVAVAKNYYTEIPANLPVDNARFARYALNEDYHDVMSKSLRELLHFIKANCDQEVIGKVYVDTGPLLEREIARLAGIGWFGKNTMIINTYKGSWFLLGELLLDIELPPDEPALGGCGSCTRCIDACPTGAIVRPYVVDSRKCISYLTIENREEIPSSLAERMGNRIFGCDICQEVCPFNIRHAQPTQDPAFQPRAHIHNHKLTDLAMIGDEEFRDLFRKSPVKRTKRKGLARNCAAAVTAPKP
jgi:epoxyqueuosine reductase